MKRVIKIKDFITIKEGLYKPNRFNVIIGQQAAGKSLLVKLDYFLNKIVEDILFQSIVEEYRKTEFKKAIKKQFMKYFNKDIEWDTSKPKGDHRRVFDMSRAN